MRTLSAARLRALLDIDRATQFSALRGDVCNAAFPHVGESARSSALSARAKISTGKSPRHSVFPRGAADSVHNAAFPGAVAEFAGNAGSACGAGHACSAKGRGAAWLGLGGAGGLRANTSSTAP